MANAIKKVIVALFVSVLMTSLMSCAQTGKRYSYPVEPLKQIVWPGKPASPRIKYLGSFSSAEDLGIEKGFFTLLAEFFVGSEDQRLIRPTAVVATSNNEIYVADPGIKGVHYFDLDDGNYKQIRLTGDYPLPSPIDLAVNEKQQILVSDSVLGKIFTLNVEAGIAVPLDLHSKLKQPTGIAYDKKRKHLYVVDTASHHVKLFNHQGWRIKTIGRRGNAKRQFNFPTFIWQDVEGMIWVTDSLNYRVQRFSASGKFKRQFGQVGQGSGNFLRPKGVATDNLGHIYVIDALFHALQIFDNKGRLLLNIGQQGEKPGEFWLPTGIYVGDDSKIYIADSHNQRIQVFQYIGEKK